MNQVPNPYGWRPPEQPNRGGENAQSPNQTPLSYGGFGAFDDSASGAKSGKSSQKRHWTVAIIALVVVATGITLWQLGTFQSDTADQTSVQDGVITVLKNSFGESDVHDAQCPAGQPLKAGAVFDCTVTIAGQQKTVPVRILNTKPEFEISAPK